MASPSPQPSTMEREIRLVENVEFKIIKASIDDAKLQQMLQRYLAPLILKTASQHAAVQARTIRALKKLEPFMEAPEIILPVEALLRQYKSTSSAIIKQFDLQFIQHSLERIDDNERRSLVPVAIRGFANDWKHPSVGVLFIIIIRFLLDVQIPPRGSGQNSTFRLDLGLEDSKDATRLIEAIGILLRLRLPNAQQDWSLINHEFRNSELFGATKEKFQAMHLWNRMPEIKAHLMGLLASGAFTDEEKLLPAICAASGTDLQAAAVGEEIIKKTIVSMENPVVVTQLSQVYLNLPAPHRARILNMVSRSSTAAHMEDWITRIVNAEFDGIPGLPDSTQGPSPQPPAGALERHKLFHALFDFLSFVATTNAPCNNAELGMDIVSRIIAFFRNQGWPRALDLSPQGRVLRMKAYDTIGLVSQHSTLKSSERVKIGDWLLVSLGCDPLGDMVMSIEAALASLAKVLSPEMDTDSKKQLRQVLLIHMDQLVDHSCVRSSRHAVVKLANECLPWSDLIGRWIDIVAVAGHPADRPEVVELGLQGLDARTHCSRCRVEEYPCWEDLVMAFFSFFIDPAHLPENFTHEDETRLILNNDIFSNFSSGRSAAFPVALRFCQQIILRTALVHSAELEDDTMPLEARVMTDLHLQSYVRTYLASTSGHVISFYLKCCLDGTNPEDIPLKEPAVEECLRCLVEVAMLVQEIDKDEVLSDTERLMSLIRSSNKNIRLLAAKATGILIAHPRHKSQVVKDCLESAFRYCQGSAERGEVNYNARAGGILTLGYVASRCVYHCREIDSIDWPFHIIFDSAAPLDVQEAALEAFSQAWSVGIGLPPESGDYSLELTMAFLEDQASRGNEKAIKALGSLGLGLTDPADTMEAPAPGFFEQTSTSPVGRIVKFLFSLYDKKSPEILFAVGDAITAITARFEADVVKLRWNLEPQSVYPFIVPRYGLICTVMDKLLQDCKTSKPSLMKASGIWLFCLVQYCPDTAEIQSRLPEIHAAFMRLIAARDEFCQETASRGLQLVYERGDADLKKTLADDLVSAFTGSGPRLKVDGETELFEPGALPTGENSSVTTYRDIMSLANEVGDQRVVYKLMSLATNAATWSTRSAFGRFGLGNILTDFTVHPELYPKLYRYRFDPNVNVRRSMDALWKEITKPSKGTVDEHFDAILQDLLKNIVGREWRMREASCAAMAHLLPGRDFNQYQKYYQEIWASALKVLDDVKGSVREEATRLCSALSKDILRHAKGAASSSSTRDMMKEAMTFLMSENGVASSVEDVRMLCLLTVIRIAKEAGGLLGPFIPTMVPRLLNLLSVIEPEQINFHYQRLGEESRDEIDRMRSQAVSHSPIMEAVENCIRHVDSSTMPHLVELLEATAKGALGLPTKIGCSRVVTTLAMRHAYTLGTKAVPLLNLVTDLMLDTNDEASRAYAQAAAYMLKAVPDNEARIEFGQRCVELYVKSEEKPRRQKTAQAVGAFSSVAPDHFALVESALLPLAFVGSHDDDEQTSESFNKVWKLHSGNTRTVVRYVSEIVDLVNRCLDSSQWSLRHTAALAVAHMAKDVAAANESSGAINEVTLRAVWLVLDRCLALKTFPGKEKLLESLPPFLQQADALWQKDILTVAATTHIVMREARRQNDDYRIHAFRCLWRYAQVREGLDILPDIVQVTKPFLAQLEHKTSDSSDKSNDDKAYLTAKSAVEAVARAYHRSKATNFRSVLARVFDALQPHFSSSEFGVVKREVWYGCVCDLMTDAAMNTTAQEPVPPDFNGTAIMAHYIKSTDIKSSAVGTEAQRVQRANAVATIVKAKQANVFGDAQLPAGFERAVELAIEEERSLDVIRVWRDEVLNIVVKE